MKGSLGTSSQVKTARTPGTASALSLRMAVIRAWACGDRTPQLTGGRHPIEVEPDRAAGTLRATATGLPDWAEGLTLSNVRAFGKSWTVHVADGTPVVGE